jgi:hypothetical protein
VVAAELVSVVWSELVNSGWLQHAGRKPKPEHLLWCLLFLNTYNVEEINAARVETSERNFREWAWFYAEGIAILQSLIQSLYGKVNMHVNYFDFSTMI